MIGRLVAVLTGCLMSAVVVTSGVMAQSDTVLVPAHIREAGRSAIGAIDRGQWDVAMRTFSAIDDPVARKIGTWFEGTHTAHPSFAEIERFQAENPDWPSGDRLRRRAERAMPPDMPPRRVVDWYDGADPLTLYGNHRLASAYIALGLTAEAQALLRRAWIDRDGPSSEAALLRRTGAAYLSRTDDEARLDRLLWAGRLTDAQALLDSVGPDARALAEVRMAFRARRDDAEAKLAMLPLAARDDPGLAYERIRWLRRNDETGAATGRLLQFGDDAGRPDLWWDERHILARRALADNRPADAYALASRHALKEGGDFAEAEWLAGWIALRFLGDGHAAFHHFSNLYEGVAYPVSLARGAYWCGRAADAEGDFPKAEKWYRIAAEHPTTFYGQLAFALLQPNDPLPIPPDPVPAAEERATFDRHELTRAARLLDAWESENTLRSFALHLGDINESAGWKVLASSLATEMGRSDIAIAIAKQSVKQGRPLARLGYPVIDLPATTAPPTPIAETPLVLALIRQESEFRQDVVSHAGARGLMQLMPGTARQVARSLDVNYSPAALTENPAYNVQLGRAYLSGLLDQFEGSYILALAAYNAGPHRAESWRQRNGDPRRSLAEAIDWIETIPFTETRNYVQRAMENLQIYRSHLRPGRPARLVETDLLR